MDKYSPAAAADNQKSEEFGLYKVIPTLDNDNARSRPRNKKRNSKKFDEWEETPFASSYKPTAMPQSKKPKNKGGCLKNALYYFCDFCENTSIHGFKFFGEKGGRFLIEKLWWFCVISFALSGSSWLIYKTYLKWTSTPVIVTFATTETPIWKIPFPAITICPEVNSDPSLFNYTDVYLKLDREEDTTEEEDEYFNLFSLVCNEDLDFIDVSKTKIINQTQLDTLTTAFADISSVTCKWLGEEYDCDSVLSHTFTSEGWCKTFNVLQQEDLYVFPGNSHDSETSKSKTKQWSLEEGYPEDAGIETYPRRTMLTGVKAGFQIDLFVYDEHLDYLCGELQGFKVTLHHPGEDPDMDNYFRVPLDQAVVAGIRPRMITTAEEIKNYRPEDRQCYLPGEKILSTYKIYSQQNCMTECLANYTNTICGCFGFYMLSEENDTTICGAGSRKCMEEAKLKFLDNEVNVKLKNGEKSITKQCGCLPACTSIEFESETSQTDWNWKKTINLQLQGRNFNYTFEKDHFARLMVYYKNLQFMTSERHELYGPVDFLANCGGLLGLFCGFSFTSSMEILYYLTLRLICNLRKFGRKFWSGASEVMDEEDSETE